MLEEYGIDFDGQVGRQTSHVDSFHALRVKDPATGASRYLDGQNDGWNPSGKAAELDETARRSAGFGKGERQRPGSTRRGAVTVHTPDALTWRSRFVPDGEGEDAASQELSRQSRRLLQNL